LLDWYEKRYESDYPLVCFDEQPFQLIEDLMQPMLIKPGQDKCEDYHYKRNGTAVVFAAVEPLRFLLLGSAMDL
jgi:hypothetical protein